MPNSAYSEVMKLSVGSINRPIPFVGSKVEESRNFDSHRFGYDDERCSVCDCKMWHTSVWYPCGADVPRETETTWDDGTVTLEPD